ncbi:DUF429 domain-containing protein [Halobacillus litoralis]|uniref:DUF429 domain-containing protein n=1 Tax=Halobacillus litoralis TaxID=45668 RepID=UPI001CFD4CA0|nr:DUF429 domain-containing protein [Halobacillus litoralis]
MDYIGIDLSGPSNKTDTVLVWFEEVSRELYYKDHITPASDRDILTFIEELGSKSEVTIGMDAPLSYEDGGGDREQDRAFRKFVQEMGMKSGSIMTPTMTRMVYLTLRGIRLTRELEQLETVHPIHIVEVHPGAAIGSRLENPIQEFLEYKKDRDLREQLLRFFFPAQLMYKIPVSFSKESHTIDACAAALAAWHWKEPDYQPSYIYPASLPLHPYDFCC